LRSRPAFLLSLLTIILLLFRLPRSLDDLLASGSLILAIFTAMILVSCSLIRCSNRFVLITLNLLVLASFLPMLYHCFCAFHCTLLHHVPARHLLRHYSIMHYLAITNRANWEIIKKKGLWGVPERHRRVLESLKPGDRLFIYVKQEREKR